MNKQMDGPTCPLVYTDYILCHSSHSITIFAAYPIINQQEHPVTYHLLKCMQAFIDLDIYTALEVHTEETLAAGHAALKTFSEMMMPQPTQKNWNFPKIHTNSHVFDNITPKGATKNYNTKPNESMHRPLKTIY
ncbi:hypothetical protein PAXRUDRAFT_782743 [Paxillus rubicundulus Ve08.2h10]|uniref:Uncharacterized protein n=1 Tax=Paxillus rubicundulus Ve08.2h10 TaxID=930991 RepID=A0A0D0D7H0_9AGAM|nr:hypothetical protein PAXRUDRAFT_782743 [Paxillus rubicundulus Ve08.2h10]